MLDHIAAGMILLTLVMSLMAFATLAVQARRTLTRIVAWSTFVFYLAVTLIAVDLVLL